VAHRVKTLRAQAFRRGPSDKLFSFRLIARSDKDHIIHALIITQTAGPAAASDARFAEKPQGHAQSLMLTAAVTDFEPPEISCHCLRQFSALCPERSPAITAAVTANGFCARFVAKAAEKCDEEQLQTPLCHDTLQPKIAKISTHFHTAQSLIFQRLF